MVDSWHRVGDFFSLLQSMQTGSGSTQPPVQWVTGAPSSGGQTVAEA